MHSNSSVIDTGLYIAKWKHVPHIWHFREVAALSFGMKPVLGDGYQRMIYSKSDRIIAISNNVKGEFCGFIPEDKTVIIPNGILPPKVTRYPDHDVERINICIVGRVESNKNQMEAVRSVELLQERERSIVKLHIIGNYKGEYGQQVEQYVKSHHLDDVIVLHGVQSDVPEMLQDMNIGLMLSIHEAFGRVTVEYMMHKMCVVSSKYIC